MRHIKSIGSVREVMYSIFFRQEKNMLQTEFGSGIWRTSLMCSWPIYHSRPKEQSISETPAGQSMWHEWSYQAYPQWLQRSKRGGEDQWDSSHHPKHTQYLGHTHTKKLLFYLNFKFNWLSDIIWQPYNWYFSLIHLYALISFMGTVCLSDLYFPHAA